MLHMIPALLLFLLPLAYSPGPGNMFFAANGARFGFRATIPANIGYHLATFLVTAAIGFGLLAALERFPQAFIALKLAGALYVLWIAWGLIRAGVVKEGHAARPAGFVDGIVLLLLNPKAYVIIALMFTQFLPASDGGRILTVILIATVFTLNNLMAFTAWTLVGDRLAACFRSPQGARRLNVVFGATLAGVAIWMALA
ncbi:LysE family translocator [Roseovarius aestuariivivens]|uniref:LysE family translocator n=1 Tax=Roseovarius aestuariivivens TaxID=1888910 RepID=UPI001081958F|nr:LysE family translocator [Roseovarius aestuariivivens]